MYFPWKLVDKASGFEIQDGNGQVICKGWDIDPYHASYLLNCGNVCGELTREVHERVDELEEAIHNVRALIVPAPAPAEECQKKVKTSDR